MMHRQRAKWTTLILWLGCFTVPALADDIDLREGHYESSALVCAYNIVPAGDHYLAEGDSSDRLTCRDQGVVLEFVKVGPNEFRIEFDRADVAYHWQILSPTTFKELIQRRLSDGTWQTTRTLLYRLLD